ncbi:MAG: response regulator, partial [Syntrophobacterales bacterium]
MKEGKTLTVLLIEDEFSHAELIMREMKKVDLSSQRVRHEPSGEEGLKAFQQEGFDLVLLDYSLPGMNGLDVLRKMKEMDYDTPVIIVTGQGNEKVAVEAMKLGAYDYVIKSANHLVTLPVLVEKTLEKYQKDKDYWNLEGIYQTIVENSTDAIILTDGTGLITFYSRGAEGIFGYSP